MNTATVGHHFVLAPQARPFDGLFDLVLIHASQRFSYLKFVKAVITKSVGKLPEVSVYRGRKLEIAWRGFPVHLDGTVMAGLDGVDVFNNPASNDQPELLDVEKPFIRVERAPYKVPFYVPRISAMETYALTAA
jgi:hypothetical protein